MTRLAAATQAVLAAYPAVLAGCRRREIPEPVSGVPLSPHLASLLEHLDPRTPLAVGELARRLRVTPATISLQLTRLVGLGLIARSRDRSDGRRVLLRLTEAGVALRQNRSLLDPNRVRAALARLSARERSQSVAGLRVLARAAVALASEPPKHLPSGGPAVRPPALPPSRRGPSAESRIQPTSPRRPRS
ncbi:MAG: MarR family winged helix-turn-helix transcriptional regulator [Gemmatimonadales bacterium]